jgi:protein-L-isoaspartate(D-aspartate) O-methyltransferase
MEKKETYRQARLQMVESQLRRRDITDPAVLAAMAQVPRHHFVPPAYRQFAYQDRPLRIGHDQTISQPYIVALMTQLLSLEPQDRVLEIGTGSGYQAAVLAYLARQVYSVERIPELAETARQRLLELGIDNVRVVEDDGTQGLPRFAPYDGIIVTAAAPKVPSPLKEQLAQKGRLVLPVGSAEGQMLERWVRREDVLDREMIAPVAFVPLLGSHGWDPATRWRAQRK